VITCHDNLNPVRPICGWVNTEPRDISHDFELCDTAEVTCGECHMDYTITRYTVFTYTTETEAE
jgi:hypothetical protein